jgi:uncharacterized protein YerC
MSKRGIDRESKELLFETLGKLKGEEYLDLFESLLSSSELRDICRRLMAAKLLQEKLTYEDVQDIMGMGSNTVNKIHFKTRGSPTIQKLFKKD